MKTTFLIVVLSGVFSFAAAPVWQPVGLSGGGDMYNPAISPADRNVAILHCDMSAAYLSHDSGASWQMIFTSRLRSNTQCRAAFHPTDPKTIISPHNSSELRISHDGGVQWETLASFDEDLIGPVTIDPHHPDQLFVGVGDAVQRSSDGGKSWRVCGGLTGAFVDAYIGEDEGIFIATDHGIWHSSDRDQWTSASGDLPSQSVRSFTGGGNSDGTTLYCTIPSQNQNGKYVGGVYRSRDAGKSWQPAIGAGLNLDTKQFDEWGDNAVAQYFDVVTSDQNPNTVWVSSASTGVPPPHQANVYRSDDAGRTWRATFFPDPRYPGFNVEKDYTVVEDGQFYQARPQIALDPHDVNHVLQINAERVYFTTDGGKSWQNGHTHAASTPDRGGAWLNSGLVVTTTWHYYIDPFESNRHYICYTDIGLSRSLDAGQTWTWWSEKGRSPWTNTCYELAFDPSSAGKLFGAFSEIHDIPNANIIRNHHQSKGTGGVCASDDFGATWTPLTKSLPEAPCTAIVIDPKSSPSARTLYAGFFGAGVYKSVDNGRSWISKNVGLGDPANRRVCRVQLHPDGTLFVLVTAVVKDRSFLAPGVGLYRSSDGGDSWQCISESLHPLWPKDFTLDPADSHVTYLSLCDANGKESGGLYRTTDGGTSWNRLCRLGKEHFSAFLRPGYPGWIYATLCEESPQFGLYLSKDNGKTFHPIESLPFNNPMRLTFDPANHDAMYVSTFGGSVWHGPVE